MSELLIEEHQKLKQQLDTVINQARENEQKMQRFQAQELRLIGTRSLAALIQNILYNYRTAFALDAVSLVLYDPHYEIHRILEEEGTRLAELVNLIFINNRGCAVWLCCHWCVTANSLAVLTWAVSTNNALPTLPRRIFCNGCRP